MKRIKIIPIEERDRRNQEIGYEDVPLTPSERDRAYPFSSGAVCHQCGGGMFTNRHVSSVVCGNHDCPNGNVVHTIDEWHALLDLEGIAERCYKVVDPAARRQFLMAAIKAELARLEGTANEGAPPDPSDEDEDDDEGYDPEDDNGEIGEDFDDGEQVRYIDPNTAWFDTAIDTPRPMPDWLAGGLHEPPPTPPNQESPPF